MHNAHESAFSYDSLKTFTAPVLVPFSLCMHLHEMRRIKRAGVAGIALRANVSNKVTKSKLR